MIISDHMIDDQNVLLINSPNRGGEIDPRIIVLHYTASGGGDGGKSDAEYLSSAVSRASAHIVVGRNGLAHQLIPFNRKAWHAGESEYNGCTGCNSYSIGIEIDNWGYLTEANASHAGTVVAAADVFEGERNGYSKWEKYREAQLARVEEIVALLCSAYDIIDIVGHEDIAPRRKEDPGPALDALKESVKQYLRPDLPPFDCALLAETFDEVSEDGALGDENTPDDYQTPEEADAEIEADGGSSAGACRSKAGIDYIEQVGTLNEFHAGTCVGNRVGEGALDGDSDPMDAIPNASDPIPVSCREIPKNTPYSFKLGKHFTVATLSNRCENYPYSIPSTNPRGLSRQQVACNMLYLVENCLDPLVSHYKAKGYKVIISSAYRNKSGGSDHNIGAAADLIFMKDGQRVVGKALSRITKEINEDLKLPYTQMIHEANKLLHIACRSAKYGGRSGTPLYWSTGFGSPVSGRGYRHKV